MAQTLTPWAKSGASARLAFVIAFCLACAIHLSALASSMFSAIWKQKRSESSSISITSFTTISGFANEPPTTTHAAQPVWTLIPIARFMALAWTQTAVGVRQDEHRVDAACSPDERG